MIKPRDCYVCTGAGGDPPFYNGAACIICNDTGHVHEVTRTATIYGTPIGWGEVRPCTQCPKATTEEGREQMKGAASDGAKRFRLAPGDAAMKDGAFIPSAGQWLYATCSAEFYGEIVAVGADANGQPTIDIRIEHPDDLIDCESVELDEEPGPGQWRNPLTTLELPQGVKPVLRHVLWRATGISGGHQTVDCNTPGDGCYRCIKHFWVHSAEEHEAHWSRSEKPISVDDVIRDLEERGGAVTTGETTPELVAALDSIRKGFGQ